MTGSSHDVRRVMVVGEPGSGKSTLARALGKRTHLPVTHIDQIIWTPGWIMQAREDSVQALQCVEDGERWIIEGFLMDTWSTRAKRADTLIWLDLPIGLRLWRVLKRLIQNYGRVRPDMSEGCPEQISREFIGFLVWMVRARHHHRFEIEKLISQHPHLKVVHLKTRYDVQRFLKGVK